MSNNYDWDSEIDDAGEEARNDGQKVIVPPGEYRFVVKALKKTHSKTKDAPMAKLTLGIYAPNDADFTTELTTCQDHLILHEDCLWRAASFFVATGDRKHGERFKPNWDEVPGAWGRCLVKDEPYNGKPQNKIEEYLEPAAAAKDDRGQTTDGEQPTVKQPLEF